MTGAVWNFLRTIASAAVMSVVLAQAKRLRWLIVILVTAVLLATYAIASAWGALTLWVLGGTGDWRLALGTAVGLWVLWKCARVAVAVRRGSARTAKHILYGLIRSRTLRRGYRRAASRTKLLGAPDDASALAPAGNWRPMACGDVQFYLGWGSVGRRPDEARQALTRFPQQFNAARAIEIPIRGHFAGSDVLVQWGDDLARLWTIGEIWSLVQAADLPPGKVPIGISESGDIVTLDANKSVLAGGMTSMGKSSLVWSFILGALIVGYRVRLHVLDPKGGIEFGALKALLGVSGGQLTVHGYLDDDAAARSDQAYAPGGFWAEIRRIMDAKETHTKALGVRQLALSGERHGELDMVVVDELLSVVNDPHFRQQKMDHVLARTAFRGRVVNVMAFVNTQDGTKETVGPMRSLFPQRVVFKTEGPDATDVVLGDGSNKAGATAHLLDLAHDKGVVFIRDESSDRIVRARVGFVSDAEAAVIARGEIPDFAAQETQDSGPCSVYEAVFAADVSHEGRDYAAGDLAYVGIADDPVARFAQHHADGDEWWAGHCDWDVVETFGRYSAGLSPRELALVAEEDRIRRCRPLMNDQHNRDNPDRVQWRGKRRART